MKKECKSVIKLEKRFLDNKIEAMEGRLIYWKEMRDNTINKGVLLQV